MSDASTLLYSSAHAIVGRFDCADGHPAWRRVNTSGPWPLFAFPGTPVEIEHEGGAAVVANASCVMLYNAEQRYRRRVLDRRGDHCVFVTAAPALVRELVAHVDPAVADRETDLFVTDHAPADARIAAVPFLLARHLQSAATVDALLVEERLIGLLAAVVRGVPRTRRPSPAAHHVELARAIERELSRRFAESRSLADIAQAAECSAFHAARVFRAATGLSIHAYRHRLRLHAVLHRLDDARDLTELALDTGFCSHSHLTESFRRAFGTAPSRLRGRMSSTRLRALDRTLWPGLPRARS
ncbi:MAG TPA: AraC family transcriptional regulator [Nannocystaceae bacterium]|nr:AraC family transcriptional regulator [Nannocystaceae bacterium]